jgi:hypothetical protein
MMEIMGRWQMHGIVSISSSANVFAIPMPNQGPLPFPKVLWIWGEESGSTFHVRSEGEYVEKVGVDLGAWAEYKETPLVLGIGNVS